MQSDPLVFSTRAYDYLCDEICRLGAFERGHIESRPFPDGERYMRVCNSVSGRDIILVGGTSSDEQTLRIFDLACTMVKYGADRLTLVIPYYGYSTMERAVQSGEVVTAKTRARLLSAIPSASRGNRVFLLDLHTEGITHYFEGELTPRYISAKSMIASVARELGGESFVLACTDAGRAKWVESLANDLGVDVAFVFKRRVDGTRTEVLAVSAQVRDRDVVVYDDMIRTGGSLVQAARAYREAGARSLQAIATHGIFPSDALDRIRSSGVLTKVVCTNSHPRAVELSCEFLRVVSIAPLLVQELLTP